MSKENEITIAGFGGQGVVLTGSILGKAAVLRDGKHAVMTQSYGPEARGGSCASQVIISETEILSPGVENPQILVAMNQEGYDKNVGTIVKDGLLIWDSDLVEPSETDPTITTYHIPMTRFAEELGNKMMVNIVMLGFLSAVSDAVSLKALKETVLNTVPPRTRDKNSMAFDRGREYGMDILENQPNEESSEEK